MTATTSRDDLNLIPARVAAQIACCSSGTLRRWAREGRIKEFRRAHLKERFYQRDEIEALRPTETNTDA